MLGEGCYFHAQFGTSQRHLVYCWRKGCGFMHLWPDPRGCPYDLMFRKTFVESSLFLVSHVKVYLWSPEGFLKYITL